MDPQSAQLWWPGLGAARLAGPGGTDTQKDGSRHRLMPAYSGGHNNAFMLTHAALAVSKVLLSGRALVAHEREVPGEPIDAVSQHAVVDGRRPAVVRHGHNAHEQRQEDEPTDAH